jgi:hypothetical protein
MTRQYPVRIQFRDELSAHTLANTFEPYSYDYVEGYSMKREGATHLLLLSVANESDFALFASACRSHPDVVDIRTIAEEEFWGTPSSFAGRHEGLREE